MSNVAVILQILLTTIGMIILGMVLNKVLGLSKDKMKEFRKKALNIQDRMRNAQAVGDIRIMAQLQRESMQFTKQIMIKQFVPLCLRCVIFIGIFGILGFIYAEYSTGLLPFPILIFGNGWVALYFIFSISISLIIYGVKRLYKKTGSTQGKLREVMEMVSPTQSLSGSSFQISDITPSKLSRITTVGTNMTSNTEEESREKPESWKDRIEK